MTEETIVAVFDSQAHADAAVRDLEAAQVPASAISRHPAAGGATTTSPSGFWSNLFGSDNDNDTAVYDRSVAAGSHLVTVKVPEDHVADVSSILERHNPIDIDERAASYGLGSAATTDAAAASATVAGSTAAGSTAAGLTAAGLTAAGTAAALPGNEERLLLSEEQLNVGKRLVNRGTTRIRRFVVETPVEENVTLHSERVSIERRPVSGDTRVADADFTDKSIEVTETEEEAVISKTARVKEEVVIRKDVSDRVQAVRDTVRREDVEITKDGETATGTTPPLRP